MLTTFTDKGRQGLMLTIWKEGLLPEWRGAFSLSNGLERWHTGQRRFWQRSPNCGRSYWCTKSSLHRATCKKRTRHVNTDFSRKSLPHFIMGLSIMLLETLSKKIFQIFSVFLQRRHFAESVHFWCKIHLLCANNENNHCPFLLSWHDNIIIHGVVIAVWLQWLQHN